MRSAASSGLSNHWLSGWALPLAVVLGLSLASGASALPGLGGLAKKAKEKVTKEKESDEEETGDNNSVTFDDMTVELTPARIDQVITALNEACAQAAGRAAVAEELNQAQQEQASFQEKHGEELQKVRDQRDEAERCRKEAITTLCNEKMMHYSQTALTDRANLDKFQKIAAKYNAAAAGGDSVAIAKAQTEMMAVMMPSHEDSVNATKNCPPVPGKTALEAQKEKLDAKSAAIFDKLRAIDDKVAAAQEKKGGMNRAQFATAHERIWMWLMRRNSKDYKKSKACCYTSDEFDAMEQRLEDLRKAFGC